MLTPLISRKVAALLFFLWNIICSIILGLTIVGLLSNDMAWLIRKCGFPGRSELINNQLRHLSVMLQQLLSKDCQR
jgi:hypothetical protein